MKIDKMHKKVYETLVTTPDYDILQYCYDQQLMTTPAAIYGRTIPPRELPHRIVKVCARRAVYAAYLLSLHAAAGDGGDIGTRYLSMFSGGVEVPRKCLLCIDDDGLEEVVDLGKTLWDMHPT